MPLKAKITFLGEEESNVGSTTWRGQKFEINKPVETTDEFIIRKAANNRFFKVEMLGDSKLPESKTIPSPDPLPEQPKESKNPLTTTPKAPQQPGIKRPGGN